MIFLQDIIAAVVQLDMQVVTVQRHFCAVNESVDYSHFPFQKHDQIREICHREQFWCIAWMHKIVARTNHSGGIQGGISNGEDIYFRVAFKPVATLLKDIETVDSQGNPTVLRAKGRHDPCVLPRAVPVVEAMAAMVILDYYLLAQSHKL